MTVEVPDVVERPSEIPPVDARPAWGPAFKRAAGKFSRDGGTDSAAMLTYYGLFSLFPALAAIVSLISLVVSPDTIIDILADLTGKSASSSDFDTVETVVGNFAKSKGAGLTLAIGVLTALWSASGYVGGFSRTMNRIYGVEEGRSVFKLRPWLYLVTAIQALMIVTIILAVALSGGLARSIFGQVGLGEEAAQVWDLAKLPFIALMVVLIIGLLYWATPNVKKPGRMFFSWGALFAFVAWVLATVGFVLYVGLSAGANYQKTFGPFATAALFMFWLWLTNVVILFGAELDAELERTRQLQTGLPAETMILLPLRDDAEIAKRQDKLDQAVAESYELQEEADQTLDENGIPVTGREPHPAVERVADSESGDESGDEAGDDVTNKQSPAGPVTTAALREDIERRRGERRVEELAQMRKQRRVRDRLEEQERAAAKKREKEEKKRQKEAEKKRKAEEDAIPLADRWAAREKVRAQYAPKRSALRDDVEGERAERRSAYRVEQAEKAANPPPPKPPKPAKVPMPSPLRNDVAQERDSRRREWYAEHPREPEEVPLPKRRDLKS